MQNALDNPTVEPKKAEYGSKGGERAENSELTTINDEKMHVSEESSQTSEEKSTENKNASQYERGDINEDFPGEIDRWDEKTIGFSFVVGTTSQALQEAGIPKKQIRWDASKIKTLLDKHTGMSKEIIKQIPELLEHPVVVIDSKSNENAREICMIKTGKSLQLCFC